MQHLPIKPEALGSFAGETQGGERGDGHMTAAITREYTPDARDTQYPRIVIYADGLTEPINPNGWGCWGCWGWIATDGNGTELASGRGCLGHGAGITNNRCEYEAALQATDWALAHGHRQVLLRVDSKLVAEQIAGRWACNATHLRRLRDELRARLAAIDGRVEWVPRERNTRADELSRLAYREACQGATHGH